MVQAQLSLTLIPDLSPPLIMTWNRRHILSLADFTTAEYDIVLQTAASFGEVMLRPVKKVPSLQGQLVTNLFFEASTRTPQQL